MKVKYMRVFETSFEDGSDRFFYELYKVKGENYFMIHLVSRKNVGGLFEKVTGDEWKVVTAEDLNLNDAVIEAVG